MQTRVGNAPYLRACALSIRMAVFVQERGLAMADEFDDGDTAETVYAIALADAHTPVACARLGWLDATTARIGRVATLPKWRGQHLGSVVLTALADQAKADGATTAVIHSECTAQGFYASLGYQPVGAVYQEDGVDCITLHKTL